MKKLKKNKNLIMLIIIAIAFFSTTLTVTWDSAHYLSYVNIFERTQPFSSWDIVRGPVFPLFIFIADKIFGKTAIGVLSLIFIIYLIYTYFIMKIYKEIFKEYKHAKIYESFLVIFSIFNPLIFGYFHTLLTEFLAITLMIISCYLSYKWINIDSKKEKIIYSLFYIVFLPFSYFLKQPYICIIIIPLIIAIVISIIKNKTLKNIVYRLSTLFLSIIALFSSIILWNSILISKNVDMNTGRDSSSMMSDQLLTAVSNFKVTRINKYSKIKNNKTLTAKEKNIAKRMLQSKKNISLIKIYDNKKVIESDIIVTNKKGHASIIAVIKELTIFVFKHPILLIESYSNNYCALSSICLIDSNDGVGYWITNKKDYLNLFENSVIAYRSFEYKDNMFYLSSEKYKDAKYYSQETGISVTSKIISKFCQITNILYKFSIILLPLFTILVLIVRIIKRKKLKKYKLYEFSMSSLLTIIACSILGQIIDRYMVYCFIPSLIGIISGMVFMISNLKKLNVKER